MLNKHLFNPYLTFEEAADQGAEPNKDEPKSKDSGIDNLEDALTELESVRKEAAKYRTRSKDFKEAKERLGKLEGIEEKFDKFKSVFGEDEELDPEKLKNEKENLISQLDTERKKSTVMMQAISAGMDPELTIAHLQMQGKLKDLDVSDSEAVGNLIDSTLKEKPGLKVNGADTVGSGGSGNNGANNGKMNPVEELMQQRGNLSNSK